MRGKLHAGILSFIILASMVVSLATTTITQAASPFTGFAAQTEISPDLYKLGLTHVYKQDDTGFIIEPTITVAQPAKDTGFKEKILDNQDDFGSWKNILNTELVILGSGMKEGVFMLVGKTKEALPGGFEVPSGNLVYKVAPITVTKDDGTKETIAPTQGEASTFSGDFAKTRATNIGRHFWSLDPTTRFFNQQNVTSLPVYVNELEPNTTYYVQFALKERTLLMTPKIALSDIITITTQSPEQALSTNSNLQQETTENYEQAQQNANLSQGNKQLSEVLYCWKTLQGDVFPTLSVSGCVAELFNNLLVPVSVRINRLAGSLFDAFAAVSVGSTIYGQGTAGEGIASFVEGGWSLVRDIANIFFIFILLYAALGLVLSLHHVDTKKLVAQVILIALLINFSLFFCRVTIDASNVLSRVFYNAMNISSKGNEPSITDKSGAPEQPISAAIIEGIQPQKILSPESLNKSDLGMGSILMVLLLAFILNLAMAWVFFMSAAFFAGRIGVIWFSMIFAPIAFVSSIVPSLDKNLKQLGWHAWLAGFMKACFNAPIFFFFLYLIVNLVGGGDEGMLGKTIAAVTSSNNDSWVAFLVGIMLPTMIIFGLLMAAKKVAEEMAGEFGGAFAGIVAAGAGLAAMAATGGAAIAARGTLGAVSSRIANPESAFGNKMRDIAAGKATSGLGSTALGKWAARQGVRGTEAGKKASFDVRNTGIANSLSKVTGVDMNVGSKVPLLSMATGSFSTESTAGGFEGQQARQAEKERAFADTLGFNKTEHDEIGKTIEKKEDAISKQEDMVADLQGLVAAAKANGGSTVDPVTGATFTTKMAQDELNNQNNILRTMKKGGDKTNPTHVWSAADAAPGSTAVKADGTKVTSADVGQLKTDYLGIEQLKKAQENKKTARAKEYYNNKIVTSGAHIHDPEKRDALGNITKFAHADLSNDWGRMGINLAKRMTKEFGSGFVPGAVVGSIMGPLGAVGTGVAFGLAKALTSGVSDAIGQTGYGIAHLAADSTHQIHKGTSSYRSPSSSFTDMFKGLGKSGGGDAGGDDHGGGGHH